MRTLEAWLILLVLALAPLNPYHLALGAPGTGRDPYVYYGYAPTSIANYTSLVAGVVVANYSRLPVRLDIIGVNESTSVQVYNLADRSLMASRTIGRMELWTIYLVTAARNLATVPSGGDVYFKVVSDKPVSVLLRGGTPRIWVSSHQHPCEGFMTIYPATDGSFIGREFIFLATPTFWVPIIYTFEENVSFVFGVESSHVVVYDSTGARASELDVAANTFAKVRLNNGSVYRVVSSGRIMIVGVYEDAWKYMPSLMGGFTGRHFFGTRPGSIWAGDMASFIAVAQEDTQVSTYDLTRPGWQIATSGPDVKKSLSAGQLWMNSSIKANKPVRVDGTNDITLIYGGGGWGWGGIWSAGRMIPENIGEDMSLIGARAEQTLTFYVPTQAVLFAPQDLSVEIDGVATTMTRDGYYTIGTGLHTVRANAAVIIEVLGDASISEGGLTRHGYDDWGGYLIAPQMLELTYPEPAPVGGLGELMPIIAAGVGIPVIVIVLVLVMRRRGKAKPATQAPAASSL